METINFRRILRITSPIFVKLTPKLRLTIAKLIPSEGVKTLFDPNSIRNYANLGKKSVFKTIKLNSGISASVDINDIIGYRAALNGEWDSTTLNLIKKLPINGTLYIDIGANIGLTSIPIAKLGYETIAFEPNPYAIVQLAKNISLNSPINFCLFPFALGGKSDNVSQLQLFSPPGNMGATSAMREWSPGLKKDNVILAPQISLDKALGCLFTQKKLKGFKNVVIKLDVEGFEDEVIRGAQDLIKSVRPIIIFENNPPMNSNLAKVRFWNNLVNYEIIVLINEVKMDFDPRRRYENVMAIPIEKLPHLNF